MGKATWGTTESTPAGATRLLLFLVNRLGLGLLNCFLLFIFCLFQQDRKKEGFDEQDLTTSFY